MNINDSEPKTIKLRYFWIVGIISFTLLIASPFIVRLLDFINVEPADLQILDNIGSYLSGIANVVVLVWLSMTTYYQLKELSFQRTDLILQRQALQEAARSSNVQLMFTLLDTFSSNINHSAQSLMHVLVGKEKLNSIILSDFPQSPSKYIFIHTFLNHDEIQKELSKYHHATSPIIQYIVESQHQQFTDFETKLRHLDQNHDYLLPLYRESEVYAFYEVTRRLVQENSSTF